MLLLCFYPHALLTNVDQKHVVRLAGGTLPDVDEGEALALAPVGAGVLDGGLACCGLAGCLLK